MLGFKHTGDFSKTTRYLRRVRRAIRNGMFDKYGSEGVAALASATPSESGLTARSWHYEIVDKNGVLALRFNNSNIQNGVPIAIIIQYGHGTGTGGWVQGRDYINPVIQPLFDRITNDLWREVTRL